MNFEDLDLTPKEILKKYGVKLDFDFQDKKHNNWFDKRQLTPKSKQHLTNGLKFFSNRELSSYEKTILYTHELTESDGIEITVYSNARFDDTVCFENGLILQSGFFTPDQMDGKKIDNPIVQKTLKELKTGIHHYDGWIPIEKWNIENVRKAIREIDESLSIFSLYVSTFFEWKPKYQEDREFNIIQPIDQANFKLFQKTLPHLRKLDPKDKKAIFRSIGWMYQGLKQQDPVSKFLFLIVSIESLAAYIEDDVKDNSPLKKLKTINETKEEKLKNTKGCIDSLLKDYESKPPLESIKMIETAYFDCVKSIRKKIESHLRNALKENANFIDILFKKEKGKDSLYGIRHTIAHGGLDALSDTEIHQVRERLWQIEMISREYLKKVIENII